MRMLFGLLLGFSIALSLGFVVALGRPRRHPDVPMAWFLASTGWAAVAIDAALFAAVLGTHVPAWLFAVVLAVQDGVFGWRLVLVLHARRHAETFRNGGRNDA